MSTIPSPRNRANRRSNEWSPDPSRPPPRDNQGEASCNTEGSSPGLLCPTIRQGQEQAQIAFPRMKGHVSFSFHTDSGSLLFYPFERKKAEHCFSGRSLAALDSSWDMGRHSCL
jgi:hypothetical protein